MTNNTCTICDKTFANPRGLRSHMSWHNPKYAAACSGNGSHISKILKDKFHKKRIHAEQLYLSSPSYCKHCGLVLPYDKRGNTFCNTSCSAKYYNLPRTKPKRESMRVVWNRNRITLTCMECKTSFTVPPCESGRKYCSAACVRKNNYHPNSTRKKTSIYKGFKMDSGAELAFAMLLDKHNITWIKNTTTYFPFIDSNGKNRKYYPDFYLNDYDYWVEIKGKRYIRPDDNLRLEAVGNIELIMSDDIRLPKCVIVGGGNDGI